jgi:hypothetical protein
LNRCESTASRFSPSQHSPRVWLSLPPRSNETRSRIWAVSMMRTRPFREAPNAASVLSAESACGQSSLPIRSCRRGCNVRGSISANDAPARELRTANEDSLSAVAAPQGPLAPPQVGATRASVTVATSLLPT